MPAQLRFGIFELDPVEGKLWKDGFSLKLAPQPLKVLALLSSRPGLLISREELQRALWGDATFVDFELGINRCIKQIRRVLGDDSETPRYIETIPRQGYRFIAPVAIRAGAVSPSGSFASSGGSALLEAKSGPSGLPDEKRAQPPRPRNRAFIFAAGGVIVLLAVVLGLSLKGRRGSLTRVAVSPRVRSLAVLPLLNVSGDPSQNYFAEGMTDELITDIGELCPIRVISGFSATQFSGSRRALPQIARTLHVDAVVEGSVLSAGGRVRVTAQLLGARTGRLLWAATYEQSPKNTLALQDNLALDIAGAVQAKLNPEVEARVLRRKPVPPEVYDDYLKGRFEWDKRTPESMKNSITYFQDAIQRDPQYAAAYAGLADAYMLMSDFNLLFPREGYQKARSAASKAQQLDPTLSDAYSTLGLIKIKQDWDWAGGEAAIKKAIALDPNNAVVRQQYSYLLSCTGRGQKAIAEARLAQRIDPLSLAIATQLGSAFYWAHDYGQAVAQLQEAIALDPNYPWTHFRLGLVYAQEGMQVNAVVEMEKASRMLGSDANYVVGCAYVCAKAGKMAEADRMLARLRDLSRRQYVSPSDFALAYADLGKREQAIEWLQKAYRERDDGLALLKVEPMYDPLRADPRFQDLLGRVGLTPN